MIYSIDPSIVAIVCDVDRRTSSDNVTHQAVLVLQLYRLGNAFVGTGPCLRILARFL